MTTLATLAGLLPLALGVGAGAGLLQPLAIAVVGGLSVSSGVSLVVIPAFVRLLPGAPDGRTHRRRRRGQAVTVTSSRSSWLLLRCSRPRLTPDLEQSPAAREEAKRATSGSKNARILPCQPSDSPVVNGAASESPRAAKAHRGAGDERSEAAPEVRFTSRRHRTRFARR